MNFIKFLAGFILSINIYFIIFLKINSPYIQTPLKAKLGSNGFLYEGLKGTHIGSNFLVLSNSNGAYSQLYRGEKKLIALFGGCNTFNAEINSHENQLSTKLSKIMGDTFVENIIKEGLYCRIIAEKLKAMNKKYDYIFISNRCSRDRNWLNESAKRCDFKPFSSIKKYRYCFLNEVKTKIQNIKQSLFLKSFHQNRKNIDNHFIVKYSVPLSLPELGSNINDQPATARWHRNLGKVTLYSQNKIRSEIITAEKIKAARKMFEAAMIYSKKVYFITEPIAYDENELPGVSEKWTILHSGVFNALQKDRDLFVNNKSHAESIRFNNKLLSRVAREYGIKTIDLDSHLRQYLHKRDDLFYTHDTLTPKGTELAAKYIHNEM